MQTPKVGENVPAWIALFISTNFALLWNCLLITACVPPLAGNASVLSNFHLMELTSGGRTVRFGYIAFCTLGLSAGKPTQICSSITNALNPSPQSIAAKLPNLNPQLFNIAFFLNRTVFPVLPAVVLTFLCLAIGLMVVHWMIRENNTTQAKKVMIATVGCLGVALMMALVSAVALTLTTAAVANMTALSNLGYVAARGNLAFQFHWLSFATILVVMGLACYILPKAGSIGGFSGGGGGGYGGAQTPFMD